MERRDDPKREPSAGGWGAIAGTVQTLRRHRALAGGLRSLLRINQPDGFDCPGCAWPEPQDGAAAAEFCENGAKAVAAETTARRVEPAFFASHSVAELRERDDFWLEQQGRLTHPMWLREGGTHYEPIGWEEAFARVGEALRALPSPDHAVFYTSGRTSNEAAFLYQLFARLFGTNNLPDCSNMCHESSGVGLGESIGVGKGTVQLSDFERAEAIFVIGQNPGTNHPRMLSVLQAAARRGCPIVGINPLREPALVAFTHPQEILSVALNRSTPIARLHLRPKVGSDVALLHGMCKALLEAEARAPGTVLDRSFIESETTGFEAFRADVEALPWEAVTTTTGVPREQIEEAAGIYARSRATILCWAMGLTQHTNGVDNVQACVNLLLLRGNLGRPGAGACPVRGHSNVQGDRTMGIIERPRPELLDRLAAEFRFDPPRAHGLDTVAAIRAMHETPDMVFVALGGNFAVATPDTAFVAESLARCRLTVQVSTKLNRSHLVTGREALILPCLGRTEQDEQAAGPQQVTVEDSMGIVHASRGHRRPASEHLRSEPAIVAGLARATVGSSEVEWERLVEDYSRIRALIERVIPGFDDFEERLAHPGGFELYNPARHREWRTGTGRAEFRVLPLPVIELPPGALRLFTIRSHDQFNTTIYGLDDRYRGVRGERRVVFMSAADMEQRDLQDGDAVDLSGVATDGRERVVRGFRAVRFDVPDGCCAAYLPEANPLLPWYRKAERSHTPASKLIPVTIRKANE